MKRAFKLAEFRTCLTTPRFFLCHHGRIAKPSAPIRFICQDTTQTPSSDGKGTDFGLLASLFQDKLICKRAEVNWKNDLKETVAELRDEILAQKDVEKIEKILEEKGVALFRRYADGWAILELLNNLDRVPSVAMQVLEWRRKQLDYASPMTIKEYSKGIIIAGKMYNVDVAVELFKEACSKQLKGTSLYNALMSAYVRSGNYVKCRSVFRELKRDSTCCPSITTYNILISVFGRLMLVDKMEATFRGLNDLNINPTVDTYKVLISGYITAWMWDEMEKTYLAMKDQFVTPNLDIHLLMLRGYALAGKLEKMEEIYKMVGGHVDANEIQLIRIMIHAYSRSSNTDRVQRVEALLSKIPESDYRPWMNVLLICLYAKEDLMEQMEKSINEAFEHKIHVVAVNVMRCIISSYFRHNAVDKLDEFVRRAEIAGWRLCRSLYHCRMVMYASEMRLSEMERVLTEMAKVNIHLSKKTLWILYHAYERWGERRKLEQVIGVMCKNGYEIRGDPSVLLDYVE
ncbi:pentatricopeptide repeat-containing protein At2g30780 [Salvia hispanica]|uniref:pentatricopeptide repeat-containing protein At2g30780 n=1 Tax=Salvia hispanica TaxID=49212 RepID=UPI0020090081|nr:pentatricopeptide repeat-containing protein At2g30780 [Salvia hispanica]